MDTSTYMDLVFSLFT